MKRRAASVVYRLTGGVCGIASSERGATSAEYALAYAAEQYWHVSGMNQRGGETRRSWERAAQFRRLMVYLTTETQSEEGMPVCQRFA